MTAPILLGILALTLFGLFAVKAAEPLQKRETTIPLGTLRFLYVFLAVALLLYADASLWYLILFFLLYILFGEFLPGKIPEKGQQKLLKTSSFIHLLLKPISYPFELLFKGIGEEKREPSHLVKQELIEMIQEADTGASLEEADLDLIESVVTFHNRIAREIMVPRVDIFALPAKTTIREAAKLGQEEGYSRIPIYKNSIDEIVGILMYKDVLFKYMECAMTGNDAILDAPIETIAKKTLYTPETKKITHLLQEFRKAQVHMAVVVDEYGGTEGVITIEDILEEIVGDIEDEYDDEAELFVKIPGGGWMVDAKMSILDIQEELEIDIPQEGDYDTVGGYIYHRAGTIPTKGFIIDHDEFTLEVISSGERGVDKVKIVAKP